MPVAQEFDLVSHGLSRYNRNQLEQSSRLLTDGQLLLRGKDDAGVRLSSNNILRMQAVEVARIKAVEDAFLCDSVIELFFIFAAIHSGFCGSQHVDFAQSQRLDKIAVLRIFIEIKRDPHGCFCSLP
jgi:hypothetical protein